MKEDLKLLENIYQNAQMGIVGIDNILDDITDKKLKKAIQEQRNDYHDIALKITKYLEQLHHQPEEISSIAKIMTYIDAKVSTMTNKKASNYAMMMIKGNNKGITEIKEKINDYEGSNNEIINLAKELLRIENKNLNQLKKFLNRN